MSDLALDPATGDMLLEGGRARLAVGAEAVAQSWRCHLTMFRGECFRDRSLGIDYQNEVLVKGARPAVLRALFTEASLAVPGVTSITGMRIALNPATRVLTVEAGAVLGNGTEAALVLVEPIGGS